MLFLLSIISKDILLIKQVSLDSWLLILWVAIPATAFSWVIWFKSIDKIGIIKTSSLFFLVPITGILFSNLFLDEKLTIFTLIGSSLILIGVYIVQRIKS